MVVRFLPVPQERPTPPRSDRADLAEVIDFRSRLAPRNEAEEEPATPASVWASVSHAREQARESRTDSSPSEPPVMEIAVKLLARKAISSGELRRALVSEGCAEFDAEDAVTECEKSLYLDDAELARTVTQKLRNAKGESRARIRQKLRDRLLPESCIEAALAELDDTEEYELLRKTAADRARRMGGLERQTAERRLMGFLARRGWSGDPAIRAVREALDAEMSGGSRAAGSTVRFS